MKHRQDLAATYFTDLPLKNPTVAFEELVNPQLVLSQPDSCC